MNRFGTLIRAAALAPAVFVVSLLLNSCATSRLEYVDTGFSETGVTGQKVTAAAVIDSLGVGLSKAEASTIADQLTGQMRKKRRKADVVRTGNPLLSKSDVSVSELRRAASSGVRYAMVIEIAGNQISQRVDCSENENTEPIYDKEGKEIGCRVVSVDYTTSAITTRKMQASYRLIDLKTGKNVWASSTNHGESNTESRTSSFDHPPAPAFPPPPVLVDVTENMSRAALRKLPRK